MGVITPKEDLILKVLSDFDETINVFLVRIFKYLINNKFN